LKMKARNASMKGTGCATSISPFTGIRIDSREMGFWPKSPSAKGPRPRLPLRGPAGRTAGQRQRLSPRRPDRRNVSAIIFSDAITYPESRAEYHKRDPPELIQKTKRRRQEASNRSEVGILWKGGGTTERRV
jgi:hypothetical protein